MTVYADSLFLINFVSEYLILILTEKMVSSKIRKRRKAAAALTGAAISVLIFCVDIPHFLCGILKISSIIVIICICYMGNKKAMIRALPVFIIISYIYAGIISSVSGITGSDSVIKNGVTYINVNEVIFAVMFLCTYPIVFLLAEFLKLRRNKRIYNITLSKGLRSVTARALFDSGNLLSESGKSVVITEWETVKPLLGIDDYGKLYEHMAELNLKLLPFRSLGSADKIIAVFHADSLICEESNTVFRDVPVGIVNRSISGKGNYNALIGKEYI